MKNYKLILIFILAIFLRLNYDIFINGYNFDEIAIMSSAMQSFPLGIIKACATNDYHAPLYPLIAHFFTHLPHEWVLLRLFNLFLSLLNIYVFYKIGCLIKSKNLGYILSLILCVNHLAISTVSFVKFYCLAFLLVSLSIYYFIKIIKSDKGFIKFAIVNFILILTSTYGFIFSFLQYLYLFIKNRNKKMFISAAICILGFVLYLPVLLIQTKLNYTNLFSPHSSYIEFSPISFYNALNDYFAPLLNYCCNLTTIIAYSLLLHFIQSVQDKTYEYHYLIEFLVFSALPVAIALICVIKGIIQNKLIKNIAIIGFSFLSVFIILTLLELTGFVPIYIYPFMLILLICFACGLDEFKNNKIKILFLVVYILINLFISNVYPPDKRDMESSKLYYGVETYFNEHPQSKMIVTMGGRFLEKYYKNKTIFDFDKEKMSGRFSKQFISLVYGADTAKKINKKNAYEIIVPIIESGYRNPEFEKYFVENVYNKLKTNDEVVFAFCSYDNTSFIDNYRDYTKWIKENDYNYHLSKTTLEESLNDGYLNVSTAALAQYIEAYSYEYLINLIDKYSTRVKFEQYIRTNDDRWVKNYEDNSDEFSTLYLAQNTVNSWIFVTYKKLSH